MGTLTFPPVISPTRKPLKYPFKLPVQLDPSCVLCLLPIHDNKWYDFSGHGNHGTLHPPIWTAKGRYGPALYFDGKDDYVDCGDDESSDMGIGSFALEVWIKTTDTSAYAYVLSKRETGGAYAIRLIAGCPSLYVRDGTGPFVVDSSISIADDNWHHLFGRVNRATKLAEIFIDGAKVKDGDITTLGNTNGTGTLQVGNYTGGHYWVTGLIDQACIYVRAPSALEIKALYEQGRP